MDIYETILGDINETTSLEDRTEICVGLRKAGWTQEQAEAATGLKWTFDDEQGHNVEIVELVPQSGRVQ
jgi:hypothetical protein